MSTLMRDWIGPEVCKHLDDVLQGTAQGGKVSDPYDEDGTFTIHITQGRAVQLTEFISYNPPYLALVSDSYTQIRAVFTKSSTDTFRKKRKRPFSRGTNGAVLGIEDYYLIFNPNSPPSQRIMFRIEGFKMQGSEGSGNFGRPVPVEDHEAAKRLLSRIGESSTNSGSGQTSTLGHTSTFKSQASISAYNSSSPGDSTDAEFSTQAPSKVPNGRSFDGHTDSIGYNKRLLGNIKRVNGQQASTRAPEPQIDSKTQRAQKSCSDQLNGVSDLFSSLPISGQHLTIPLKSTIRPTAPLTGSTKKRAPPDGDVLYSQAASESDTPKSQRVGRALNGRDSGIALSQGKSTKGRTANGTRAPINDDKSLPYAGAILTPRQKSNSIIGLVYDANYPWEGLARIPRHYVQIPKDQQATLECDDAWYTQTSGNRHQDINLPLDARIDLQAFHDRLRKTENEGQKVTNDNKDKASYSDSDSAESEVQARPIVSGSHGVNGNARTLAGSTYPTSSGAVPSAQRESLAQMASSEPLSSHGAEATMEGYLDVTEVDSDYESGVAEAERHCVQGDKNILSGKILLENEFDSARSSFDHEDGSSVEEATSWPPTPNDIETCSLGNHSSQKEAQSLDSNDCSNDSELLSSHALPVMTPQVASAWCESASGSEDSGDSNAELLSTFKNDGRNRPTTAAERIPRASKTGPKNSGGIFSSSPVELELSVPHALRDETRSSHDVSMTNISPARGPVQHARETSHLRVEVQDAVFPGNRSQNVMSAENEKLRPQNANVSSDPIIPSTFMSETSNVFAGPRERVQPIQKGFSGNQTFEADQVISATPVPTPPLFSSMSPPESGGRRLAKSPQNAGFEAPTEKRRQNAGSEDRSLSVNAASRALVGREQPWNANDVDISTSSRSQERPRLCIARTQPPLSEPLLLSHAPRGSEITPSTLTTPIKQRASGLQDTIERPSKRQRISQAAIFSSALEKESPIDPTEMAKANRRKFLQELSCSSPVQSPNKVRDDIGARPNAAFHSVTETSFENTRVDGSAIPWKDDASSMIPHYADAGMPFGHLINSSTKNLQGSPSGHSSRDQDVTLREGPHGRIACSRDIQKGHTGPYEGTMHKIREMDSTKTSGHWQDIESPVAAKVQPDHEQSSHTETVFDLFNKAYPSYGKNLGSFIRACVYLESLQTTKSALHPSLWDDFIRAFSGEFLNYARECKLSKKKAMNAPEFYNKHVPEPVFKRRIMTLTRLREAFLLDPTEAGESLSKIYWNRHQNSQESTSKASSQITVTSDTSAMQQEKIAAFLGNSCSAPELPEQSAHKSHGILDSAKDDEMAPKMVLDTVLAPGSVVSIKRPFFETSSQLVIQGRQRGSLTPSTSALTKEGQNSVLSEGPEERLGPLDFETVMTNTVSQTPRHLAFLSLTQDKVGSRELFSTNGAFPEPSKARSQGQTYRQSTVIKALRQREGSPVLGIMDPNLNLTANQPVQSDVSPILSSSSGFRQDPVFKTPSLPAPKPIRRRVTGMPKASEDILNRRQTVHNDAESNSPRTTKGQNQVSSSSTGTFKDFSKAFVPRQKRRSSVLSRVSTPGSDNSPSGMAASDTSRPKLAAEPDTQAWRF